MGTLGKIPVWLLACIVVVAVALTSCAGASPVTPDTDNESLGVIACDDMSGEDKFEALLVATLGVLLVIATPVLSRDTKIILWLFYLAVVYGFVIVKTRRKWGNRMTFPVVVVVGMLFSAAASVVAW